jgi:RTC4-like domain
MKYSSRNAAQASIALTYRNYTGPTLLQVIDGRRTSPTAAAAASWPTQMSPTAKRESSEDINAPPESSSSDEEVSIPVKPTSGPQLDQVFKDIGQDVPTGKAAAAKESKGGTRSTRSRQPRLKDEGPQLLSSPLGKNESSREDELVDLWASQPNKRRRTTYGAKNVRTSGNFIPVPTIPSSPERGKPASSFSVPEISYRSPQGRTRSSLKDNFIPPPPALSEQTVRNQTTGCTFNIPADITTDITSSATTASESLPIFDLADSPKFSTKRSNSTSSLSSVDSIASLVFTQERKEALRQGKDDDDNSRDFPTSRCPLCHSKVDQVHLETFNFGRRLNIRDQQRFCQEHKHRDAEKQRQEKEYPSIDWVNLTNNRIPKHIAVLSGILQRTLPSHYRDRLDAAMHEAKTSRKALQRYLKDGVVDVAKHGYYGPKGARIMGHTITTHMSEALKQELKRDKVARAVGVGGYVNAVLVPELAVRLVMEDMGLTDEQRARDVLSESSNVGILLNADDENVTREEEGEEG